MKKYLFYLLIPAFFLAGCTQEAIIGSSLDGIWNIAEYERTIIHRNGSTTQLLYEENAGTWQFSADDITDETSRYYIFTYTGSQGSQSESGYMNILEGGQRFMIYGGQCIGCDRAFTIEDFSHDSFTLTNYSPQNDTLIYKLRMHLEKQ